MVNYHGPEVIRKLVELLKIPIFNRVSQISHRSKNPSELQLQKRDIIKTRNLERIAVTKLRGKAIDDSDVEAVRDIVPPCRLASVHTEKLQVDINIIRGPALGCASP